MTLGNVSVPQKGSFLHVKVIIVYKVLGFLQNYHISLDRVEAVVLHPTVFRAYFWNHFWAVLKGPYVVTGTKQGLAVCKVNALSLHCLSSTSIFFYL